MKKCLVDELGMGNFYGKAFIPNYDCDIVEGKFKVTFEISRKSKKIKSCIDIVKVNYVFKFTGNKSKESFPSDAVTSKDFGGL